MSVKLIGGETTNQPILNVFLSELIREKYEEMHRSLDGMGIKTLDFYIKKKTDHYNNLINTYVLPIIIYTRFNCSKILPYLPY